MNGGGEKGKTSVWDPYKTCGTFTALGGSWPALPCPVHGVILAEPCPVRCQAEFCVIPWQWCCAEPHHRFHFLSPLGSQGLALAVKWDVKWQNWRDLSETLLAFKIINLYWLNFLNIFQELQQMHLFVCVLMRFGAGLRFYFLDSTGLLWMFLKKLFFSQASEWGPALQLFFMFHQLLREQSKWMHKLRTCFCLPC